MAGTQERTFIMVKPDGVQRGLVGEILKRFEAKGFKLVALKMVWVSLEYHTFLFSPLKRLTLKRQNAAWFRVRSRKSYCFSYSFNVFNALQC